MNKLIKLLLVGIVVCIVAGVAFLAKKSDAIPKSETAWEEKYPVVFKTAGDTKIKIDARNSIPMTEINRAESMVKLEGTITNKFGIRDDILEYLLVTAPHGKPLVMRAAFKLAQIEQLIYYGDISADEAIRLADNEALVSLCLLIYTGNFEIDRGIDKRMRNSKERDALMWAIDRKYFSWKIIGSGLSVADEKIACEKGDF